VEGDWALDADDLLLTFMACGGETFLQMHAPTNIHAQLGRTETGSFAWTISAIDPVAKESFTVGIDALSRQVIHQG
jgi:hypothetical protein